MLLCFPRSTCGDGIRVCMLTNSVYRRDTRVRRYAEYLIRDGYQVDVICLPSQRGERPGSISGVRVYPIRLTRSRREGLRQALQWLLSAFLMFLRLSALDIRQHYDLIHAHNIPDFLVFCAVVPRLRGAVVLLNLHDPSPELARSKLGLPSDHPVVRINAWIEKICVRFSSHVLTATNSFKALLVQRGIPDEKITVVMNAADRRFFSPDWPGVPDRKDRERFTLLYVGTVAERYGLHILVRALPLLRSEIPGIRLRVVPKIRNEGKGLDDCLELAERLGVGDLVRVDEPVPLEEMPSIMKEADIGCYPALRDCHMDIALSLKIPEMVDVGLCIVASRLSVLEDLYGEDAIAFVPPGDPNALADRIIELYRNPRTRQQLAATARERAQDFSWERQYEIYKATLEKLLSLTGNAGA